MTFVETIKQDEERIEQLTEELRQAQERKWAHVEEESLRRNQFVVADDLGVSRQAITRQIAQLRARRRARELKITTK